MAEADDMQSVEALSRRVDALDGDVYAAALEVRDILDADRMPELREVVRRLREILPDAA